MALTKPTTDMITAKGDSNQTEIKVENNKLVVTSPEESDVSEIVEARYDENLGILSLVFSNDKVIDVKGFPTPNNLLRGDQGLQGERGEPGKDGQDGKDGEPGDPGCRGDPGPKGEKGDPGENGADGRKGAQGDRGPTGPEGPRGPDGNQGPQGDTGKRGDKGDRGFKGETGDKGDTGTLNIIISDTDPGDSAGAGTLWVNPSVTSPEVDTTNPSI